MGDIISKISAAAKVVGGKLGTDKTNVEQRYDYISADKILSVCGQALFDQGVVVLPSIENVEQTTLEYTDSYGKTRRRYDVRVAIHFAVEDGTSALAMKWAGMGADYSSPDKALYKAITSGHKYFLMKLLCIGAGNEDAEHEFVKEEPSVTREARNMGAVVTPTWEYPDNLPVVPFEEAVMIQNSQEIPYGDIPKDKLKMMRLGLSKVEKRTEEQNRKYGAIKTLLETD